MISRMKKKYTLFFPTRLNIKLILIFIICFIVATITFLFIALHNNNLLLYNEQAEKESKLKGVLLEITEGLEKRNINTNEANLIVPLIQEVQLNHPEMNFLVADPNNQTIFQTKYFESNNISAKELLMYKLNLDSSSSYSFIKKSFILVSPISFQNGIGYIIVQSPNPHEMIIPSQYNLNFYIAFGSSIFVFILLFFIFMLPITRYIKEIEQGIQRIVQKDWNYSIRVKGKDELSSLASNVNWMSNQLRERFEKEREIEKSKREFITNISHDLRTPLTSIIGYLGLLKEKQYHDESELQSYIHSTYSLSMKLKSLINELFEYNKLSLPDVKMKNERVELGGLLSQLVGEYIPIFEKNQLKVQMHSPIEPIWVNVDIAKIVRVFDNLLSNAEKYSYKNSEVFVELQREKDKAVISITNTTDPIEFDELAKMFNKFYRVDKARTSQIKGSGIGLAIVKRTIDLHTGKVWAESIGNQLTIYIELPLLTEKLFN